MAEHTLLKELEAILQDARKELDEVAELGLLESWRVAYLGRRGRLTLLLRSLGSLPVEERRIVGAQANQAKAAPPRVTRSGCLSRVLRERL